jgi:hypothetical protein
LDFRFYMQVQLFCIFFVFQHLFHSLCFYGLPKQKIKAARYLR